MPLTLLGLLLKLLILGLDFFPYQAGVESAKQALSCLCRAFGPSAEAGASSRSLPGQRRGHQPLRTARQGRRVPCQLGPAWQSGSGRADTQAQTLLRAPAVSSPALAGDTRALAEEAFLTALQNSDLALSKCLLLP